MLRLQLFALLMLLPFTSNVYADEVSLLSGFYDSQDNDPGFKRSTISLGGRYGLDMDLEGKYFWFIDAGFSSTSYSGENAPDGSTGFNGGAGQKYFFKNFGKSIHTFLAWAAGYRSESSEDNTRELESSGLYYRGHAGFRFDFTKSIFFDIDVRFFDSYLVGEVESTNSGTGAKQTTKSTQLRVDTISGTDGLTFGVGMLF